VARGKTSAEIAQMPDLALPWPIVPDDHKDNAHKQGVRIEMLKSYPLRVYSRTPLTSRRAMMRKPSCFISCSQSGPNGGSSAREGSQGEI
jgi:hypothetical protein